MQPSTFLIICLVACVAAAPPAESDGVLVDSPQLKLTECSQSTTSHGGVCQRAIDGNRNQDYSANSCTHTGDSKGWWQASTEKKAQITHVRIYNRLDCCSDALNNFVIMVGDQECVLHQRESYFSVKTFVCNAQGQDIRIKSHLNLGLTLCEVEVFGRLIENKTQQLKLAACYQSSTAYDAVCQRAIDGNKNQDFAQASCSHTHNKISAEEKNSQHRYFGARIERMARISRVRIYNRMDCCPDRLNNFVILVGDKQCASYQSDDFFSAKTFECDAEGTEIYIESHDAINALTLCEIEVFGEYVWPTDN